MQITYIYCLHFCFHIYIVLCIGQLQLSMCYNPKQTCHLINRGIHIIRRFPNIKYRKPVLYLEVVELPKRKSKYGGQTCVFDHLFSFAFCSFPLYLSTSNKSLESISSYLHMSQGVKVRFSFNLGGTLYL